MSFPDFSEWRDSTGILPEVDHINGSGNLYTNGYGDGKDKNIEYFSSSQYSSDQEQNVKQQQPQETTSKNSFQSFSRPPSAYTPQNQPQRQRRRELRHIRRRSFSPSTIRLLLGHTASFLLFLFSLLFRSNNLPLLLNFLHHSIITRSYLFAPGAPLLIRYTNIGALNSIKDNPLPQIAIDLLRYLGGIHSSLATFSILTLIGRKDSSMSTEKLAFLVLAVANGMAAWLDMKNYWRGRGSGRWNWTFLKERALRNSLIALMNCIAYGISVRKTRGLLR
ncbi:hypothetical protein G9A89_021869 [Geosiphon pyriformis]|nr:hypothetical protein G9A89_021869 [Geosiphon pyriformis]